MKNNKFKSFLKKAFSGRMAIVSSIVALILVGATVALMFSLAESITNTFKPGKVAVEVREQINGNTKEVITLTNTGRSDAYLRMAISSYYTGTYTLASGGSSVTEIVGSMPASVTFNLNEADGWVKRGDYYYYTKPVAPGEFTGNLINGTGITLDTFVQTSTRQGEVVEVTYRQVVEVFAEAIQSEPPEAISEAWGVTISENSVVPYSAG